MTGGLPALRVVRRVEDEVVVVEARVPPVAEAPVLVVEDLVLHDLEREGWQVLVRDVFVPEGVLGGSLVLMGVGEVAIDLVE